MSEGERAVTISADYPLSFVFARARFCPDTIKILEDYEPFIGKHRGVSAGIIAPRFDVEVGLFCLSVTEVMLWTATQG
jgi:hypothetical protein